MYFANAMQRIYETSNIIPCPLTWISSVVTKELFKAHKSIAILIMLVQSLLNYKLLVGREKVG